MTKQQKESRVLWLQRRTGIKSKEYTENLLSNANWKVDSAVSLYKIDYKEKYAKENIK